MGEPAHKFETWEISWLNSRDNPLLFVTGVLGLLPYGVPNPNKEPQLEQWQQEFLDPKNFFTDPAGNATNNPRHSVRSGHGVGKDATIAWLALWHTLTRYDSKAVITAASQDQLRDTTWPELRKWWRRLPDALKGQVQIDEERMYLKAAPEMAFVVRRTASKHNPEALQGFHAEFVMFLLNEASGIAEVVVEIAYGALSTPGAIACMFSNPTKTSGFFHDTHHRLRDRWKCRRVNCEDVPRARHHIDDVIATYGKDSNKYRVRVLGEFPTKDDDTVIPLELVEAARGRKVQITGIWPVWGVDVARFGDDRTAVVKRQGNTLLEPPIVWRDLDTVQVSGRVVKEYRETPKDMRPKAICVDVIGYGAGVVDILSREGELAGVHIIGVNVAESPAVSDQDYKLRDELWWRARQWFHARDCTIPEKGCEDLIADLTAPTYDFTSGGKRIVESKSDMKKRGLRSPDLADALIHSLCGGVYPRDEDRHRRGWRYQEETRDPWAA